ncbi:uncharacterized protein GlcG (DUF336 family) [Paraburkholderia atlantica]|uniref:hypothetical protein n=1 Tax=Paraburkholderia atlantica TaxID=2654982 RepID=UPI003D25FABE
MAMTKKATSKKIEYVVKEHGQLVTVERQNGAHVMTVRRETAIKSGLIKPKRGK